VGSLLISWSSNRIRFLVSSKNRGRASKECPQILEGRRAISPAKRMKVLLLGKKMKREQN
jgi:hypothetical protein